MGIVYVWIYMDAGIHVLEGFCVGSQQELLTGVQVQLIWKYGKGRNGNIVHCNKCLADPTNLSLFKCNYDAMKSMQQI